MKPFHEALLAAACGLLLINTCSAIGVKGNFNRGASGAGGARPSPNLSRPAGGLSSGMSRPSTPNLGGGSLSRPAISRPTPSLPSGGLGGVSRPSVGLPTTTRPSVPSGGLRPSTRPSLPSTGGMTRPSLPGTATGRPSVTLPGATTRPGTSTPNLGGNWPGTGTLPGVTRPGGVTTLPGQIGQTRPGGGATTLPGATTRPGGVTTLPGTRPGGVTTLPGNGGTTLPGATTRPTPGGVGDFLGMQRPVTRPGTVPGVGGTTRPGITTPGGATTLPGLVNQSRPGITRPGGVTTLPSVRPGGVTTRPVAKPGDVLRPGDITARPAVVTRPAWTNRPNYGNTIINTRPGWAQIGNNTQINITNNFNNVFTRPANNNWWSCGADRLNYWNGWGNSVRHHWGYYHQCHNWFNYGWWYSHPHSLCGWHYHYHIYNYPPYYWWTVPTWNSLTTWFTWGNYPTAVWRQPVYYDYGSGGNVTYQNNTVYVAGQPIASARDYAMSAAALATVPPPKSAAEAEAAEWLPLGTFAVATSREDVDPTRVVQLAVSKSGIVAGTFYNPDTDQAQTVQGQVDKETQRVAVRIGDNENLVVETGLYNLTQDDAPLLVHFGPDHTENWLLVRLEANESTDGQ